MKTLIVVRHAKSSWDAINQPDFDRTLNDRGKRDAPQMAQRLKEKGVAIDAFISSPAKRARKTAVYFADAFDVSKKEILLVDDLYEASLQTFINIVAATTDKYNCVALFAHNPAITDFVNTLTEVRVDNMPTCAVFAVQADVESWHHFAEGSKRFLFFDAPKNPLGYLD